MGKDFFMPPRELTISPVLTPDEWPQEKSLGHSTSFLKWINSVEQSESIKKRCEKRLHKQMEPKTTRFVKKFCDKKIYDHSELDEDYEKWGKDEHEAILRESAELIKRHEY
jgi:hypothetical protein